MNPSLPIFAVPALWAGALTPCAQQAGSIAPPVLAGGQGVTDRFSGEALLQRMMAEVDRLPTMAAKVRYRISLLDQTHLGKGLYLQQGRGVGRQVRFELEV